MTADAFEPFEGSWVRADDDGTLVCSMRVAGDHFVVFEQFRVADAAPVRAQLRATVDGEWTANRVLGAPPGVDVDARVRVADDALVTETRIAGELATTSRHTIDEGQLIRRTVVHGGEAATDATEETFARAPVKQVICYRRDLKMRKGKIAAQVAHASLRALLLLETSDGDDETMVLPLFGPVAEWVRRRFAKVVLSLDDEAALLEVHRLAREAGIPCALITDSGRTEFGGRPTKTTVAVGPWAAPIIDAITGPNGAVSTKLA